MSGQLNETSGLRVFMTVDAVGGIWQYATDLAKGLRAHDVEVTLAVLGPSPTADQERAAEDAGLTLIQTGLPLDWTAVAPDDVMEAGRALACIATHAEPDIIHLNNPALAAGGAFPAPIVAVCHSCVTTWWHAVRSGPLPEELAWHSELARKGYLAADVLLAPTTAFARATAEIYQLGTTPIVVRNGRHTTSHIQASEGLFAFTAGRLWDDGKNIAALDRAAARLSLSVLAAGPLEGPNGTRVEAHHLRTLGRVSDDEIRRLLSAKPIFISCALYEPFGLSVLEAAQAGCALVLSDIPTFRELWNEAAVFVPPDDDEAIARTVLGLAQEVDLRIKLGEAAQAAAKTYTVEAMSAGTLAVYRSLLAPNGQRFSSEGVAA